MPGGSGPTNPAVTGLNALHRSGQTFITWNEVGTAAGESYRVYRHSTRIAATNLAASSNLATIAEGSSYYAADSDRAGSNVYFVITNLGPQLAATQGLFVYTTHDTGTYFYAVTVITNGVEGTNTFDAGNALTSGVAEVAADPKPVLVRQTPNGLGWTYTQFMDYDEWNPTFEGYAYNYAVAVPSSGYTTNVAWPAYLYLQGWGGRYEENAGSPYDWPAIEIYGDDPHQTWYYGFSATFDYSQGGNPTSGPIVNFGEQQLLRAIYDTVRDPYYRVDTNRIYIHGQSMGGSGALSLGMRYPNIFAAIHAGQPMTRYGHATNWLGDYDWKWGTVAANLPIENRGRHAAHLAKYNGIGVYDWMDHLAQLTNRIGDEMAYLSFSHGIVDDVIRWADQGQPMPGAFYSGRRAFFAWDDNVGHSWMGFNATANWNWDDYSFRRDRSFPAFSRASGSGPILPTAPAEYNRNLEWSCPWNDFAGDIVDTPSNYELVVRSLSGTQTSDITPRRLQVFPHAVGTRVLWRNTPVGQGTFIQAGTLAADGNGLIVVTNFEISAGGNRLRIQTDDRKDSDGDGIPDYWEEAFFGGVTNADVQADGDGDFVNERDEYRAGTYPLSGGSFLRITAFDYGTLSWASVPGFRYTIEEALPVRPLGVVTATANEAAYSGLRLTNGFGTLRINCGN